MDTVAVRAIVARAFPIVDTSIASDNLIVCECEAHGLNTLAATHTIRVPRAHSVGCQGSKAYLLMEFLTLRHGKHDYAALGTALGRLHAHPPTQDNGARFGLDVDNFLGATPQPNTPRARDWIPFFRTHRLQYQLDLLVRDRAVDAVFVGRVQRVIDAIDVFFDPDETIVPSFVHGDLWQGNWGFTEDGEPVVFDPACYVGHSEAELAMMTLFGELPLVFYDAYTKEMPRARRFDDRVPLYQLYHALYHYNLFGGGYQSLCEALLTPLEKTMENTRESAAAHGA